MTNLEIYIFIKTISKLAAALGGLLTSLRRLL